jgi:hypothetical protein
LGDLRRIESEHLIPGASYFEPPLPYGRLERAAWRAGCLAAFNGLNLDLAFFDPDNGLQIKARPRGQRESSKYAFIDELAAHYAADRSIRTFNRHSVATAMGGKRPLRMCKKLPVGPPRSPSAIRMNL